MPGRASSDAETEPAASTFLSWLRFSAPRTTRAAAAKPSSKASDKCLASGLAPKGYVRT